MTAKQLAKVGLDVMAGWNYTEPGRYQALVEAIAAMLAEALKEKKQRAKKPLTEKADYKRGMERLAFLSEDAPDAVIWQGAPSTIAALGKRHCGEDDLYDLGRYLRQGGLAWMREKPALSYVVRNFEELVGKAQNQVRPQLPQVSALDKVRKQ